MADFVEIWSLRNSLILDGHYDGNDPVDPLELERKITDLAYKYYFYEPPEPLHVLAKEPVGAEHLGEMTPKERIRDALDILLDWDGCRSLRTLGELVDEVRERLAYPKFESEINILAQQMYLKGIDVKTVFLRALNSLERQGYMEEIFFVKDLPIVRALCEEHDLHIVDKIYHHEYEMVKVRIEKNEPIQKEKR